MGRTASDFDPTNRWSKGTLETKFKNSFRYGRVTQETCPFEGRMPNPEHGCEGRGEGKDGLK